MARLIAERDKGVDLKPQQATFEELAQRWRDSHYPDIAQSTVDTYETLLAVHVLPVLSNTRLRDIRPLHVEAVKTGVIKAGRSQKLALNVYRLVAAILRQAVRWQLLSTNPADAVAPPKPRRYRAKAPTQEQLGARCMPLIKRLMDLWSGWLP
jgi:integrase